MAGPLEKMSTAVSEPIFGREKELKAISEALMDSHTLGTSLLVIEGAGGIGKTTLIKRALENYGDPRCFKLYGKFENHRENTPYSAFKQAFSSWAQQILLLPDEEYDSLKDNATSALQTNVTAITDIFEELEVFFSRKYLLRSSFETQPHQLKARFFYFLKKFFRSITGKGYKVIIFLDDLQWSDRASYLLLEELLNSKDIPGLQFITAARPALEKKKQKSSEYRTFKNLRNVNFISLKPLSRTSVKKMVPGHWNFSKQHLEEFQNYLWLESSGNPFRIREIIRIIERDSLNGTKVQDPLFWESLPKLGSQKDTVAFIQRQLRDLPFHRLQVLASATCLGYSFNSALLKKILNLPESDTTAHLRHLTKMELLIRKRNVFVFTHDTIFSAANSLLSNFEKCDIHYRTGRYLLDQMETYDGREFLNAVNHLNKAKELAGSKSTFTNEQILLNLQAGNIAIKNTAFEMAHKYFATAEGLFSQNPSNISLVDPRLIEVFKEVVLDKETILFSIYHGYAQTSFLLQDLEAALDYVQHILNQNCTGHQLLKATLIKMMICSALVHQKNVPHILVDCIASLEQALSRYGICIPEDRETIKEESAGDCHLLIKKAARLERQVDFTKLINPDKEYQDLMNLVTTSLTLLYYADPYKSLYMVTKTLLLNLEKGFAPVTPVLFSASFFTGFISEENRNLAHFLGKLSLKMIEKDPFKRYSYMVHYVAALNFMTWELHYKFCIDKLEESSRQAIEAGDPHYASFCQTIIRIKNSYRGKNLAQHIEDCAKLESYHVFFIRDTDNVLVSYLTGDTPGFSSGNFRFSEEILTESEHNPTSRYNLLLALEKLNYIAGFTDAAVSAGEECDSLEFVGKGYQIELEHFFFYSLSLLRVAYTNPAMLPQVLEKIRPMLGELQRLSAFKSGNFLHKVYLLEAEIAKCKADFEQATLFYDLAIEEAEEQEFIHHAGIAAERAFEYYRDKNRNKQAKNYFKKSLKFYKDWGAAAKVKQLMELNPSFYSDRIALESSQQSSGFIETVRNIIGQTTPGRKISLAELAEYLLSLLLKEKMAKKAAIIICDQNTWKVIAFMPDGRSTINRSLKTLQDQLPLSVLNYSIKKGERMFLGDISRDPLFAADPYLQKEQIINLSVFPISQSHQTAGLLYLENSPDLSEAERDEFLLILELVSSKLATKIYYDNNDALNRELKLQEKNRIEAVIESQENERQRIARDLHDSLGQTLALSKINLSRLHPDSLELEHRILIDQVMNLIDEGCTDVRMISHNLMPPDLDNKSLKEILENLIEKNRQSRKIEYSFRSYGSGDDISVAGKYTLYRVLQEILQNIIKHASASSVTISLTTNNEFVNLLVEDNGKGFDTNLTGLGLGLKNIHSRIKLLNGHLDIDSSINNGTNFNISIPTKV
ncbi:AAA family ATPase [Salinimicrobium sp. TH3]|uniref:AAA family ATPase n=1 Tax=Salinimicrobium sp. TH3 TaxID=2997342 RepID=UPI0022753A0C|nr:AAA family ATPase [Salinimicrobium sp. TH3]MCY2687612.1 AAA family ATPase [Salinimicrobium sp. TH3]